MSCPHGADNCQDCARFDEIVGTDEPSWVGTVGATKPIERTKITPPVRPKRHSIARERRQAAEDFLTSYDGDHPFLLSVRSQIPLGLTEKQINAVLKWMR